MRLARGRALLSPRPGSRRDESNPVVPRVRCVVVVVDDDDDVDARFFVGDGRRKRTPPRAPTDVRRVVSRVFLLVFFLTVYIYAISSFGLDPIDLWRDPIRVRNAQREAQIVRSKMLTQTIGGSRDHAFVTHVS